MKIVLEKGQDPEHLLRPGMSIEPDVSDDVGQSVRFPLTPTQSILSVLSQYQFWSDQMSVSITTRQSVAATIVDVTGEVTLFNAPELRKVLMNLLKLKKTPSVIVNMTNAPYIDSAGAACLVEALKVARESKVGFALFGLNRVAKEVLELTRLIHVFDVYGTEEEALSGRGQAPSATVS